MSKTTTVRQESSFNDLLHKIAQNVSRSFRVTNYAIFPFSLRGELASLLHTVHPVPSIYLHGRIFISKLAIHNMHREIDRVTALRVQLQEVEAEEEEEIGKKEDAELSHHDLSYTPSSAELNHPQIHSMLFFT